MNPRALVASLRTVRALPGWLAGALDGAGRGAGAGGAYRMLGDG